MKKLLSLLMASVMISMTMSAVGFYAAADASSEGTIATYGGEQTAAEPIKLAITADTVLAAHYENKQYGKTPHGSDTAMFFAQQKPNAYETGPLLYKTDLSDIVIPEGKVVTKVELFVYAVAEGSKTCGDFTNNVRIFNASTNWDESTTYMKAWDTKYDNKSGLTPNISWDKNAENYSCQISDQPDATCSTSFKKFASNDTTPIAYSFDITPAFMAAYPGGTVTDGGEFAWIVAMTPDGYYRYVTVASKEHENPAVHPYLQITVSDKVAMTADGVTFPETEEDSFTLTASNNIKSAQVRVNGEALEDGDFGISGKSLVVKDIWRRLTTYKVEVDATDIYDQIMPKQTYYFTVGYDTANDGEEILCYDKAVNISGSLLKEAKFLFTTSFDEAVASDARLVKDYGTSSAAEVQHVDFVYNDSDSSISLSDAVALDIGSMYTIVLKAGVQDKFSNVLGDDLILALCYAADLPAVTSAKLLEADFEDYENYETTVSKVTIANSDRVKTVCKINNESDSDRNVLIFTVAYDSEGAFEDMTVSVVEAAAQTNAVYAGNALEITGTCASVKAFVWSAGDNMVLTETIIASK